MRISRRPGMRPGDLAKKVLLPGEWLCSKCFAKNAKGAKACRRCNKKKK